MDKNQFLTEENSLALYLKEIGKNKTLPVEEEAQTAVRIRKGDRKALEKLVKANLRFVVSRRAQLPEPGAAAFRSYQRGKPRPHPRRQAFRRKKEFQVHLLRGVVDPPGDPAGAGRTVAHHQAAAQPRGHHPQNRQGAEQARTEIPPHPERRGNRARAEA